jgi:hypothetical protein
MWRRARIPRCTSQAGLAPCAARCSSRTSGSDSGVATTPMRRFCGSTASTSASWSAMAGSRSSTPTRRSPRLRAGLLAFRAFVVEAAEHRQHQRLLARALDGGARGGGAHGHGERGVVACAGCACARRRWRRALAALSALAARSDSVPVSAACGSAPVGDSRTSSNLPPAPWSARSCCTNSADAAASSPISTVRLVAGVAAPASAMPTPAGPARPAAPTEHPGGRRSAALRNRATGRVSRQQAWTAFAARGDGPM